VEHAITLLTALGVVEWHSALRHLEAMYVSGDISDTLIDIVADETDRRAKAWVYARDLPEGTDIEDAVVDARKYLTENVEDLDALLAERS
jgi:hypothetical protein